MDVFAPLAYAASPFGGEAQMWRCEIIYLSSLMSTMSSVVRFFTSTAGQTLCVLKMMA